MAHGTLVVVIGQGKGVISEIVCLVLEDDPECTGLGRIGSEEHARRAVHGEPGMWVSCQLEHDTTRLTRQGDRFRNYYLPGD